MKTKIQWLPLASGIAMAACLLIACSKENSLSVATPAGASQLSVYMMDDPVPFTKVLIDIKQVAVKIDTAGHRSDDDDNHQWNEDYRGCKNGNSTIWDTLNIKPGVYDLLQLRNGTDTLLASGAIPNGKVLQVRITLGTNNSVYTDSVTSHPLVIAGARNYFDINVRRDDLATLSNTQLALWFDFNLARSIFYANNTYWLKPELKPFNDRKKAKLEGRVLPERGAAYITVYNATDTLYALPWGNGYYQVRGINAGTYSLFFKGRNGYKDSTVSNISVSGNGTTKVPTVTLIK